ncbi:uncharacterized protein TRAVEDRAFT_31204 [Trametes versicolor FP-101664 SS1]|uniref:uncharacterized protein n=1 Tax=Trametes versicolor (strain FP-101664) TaxID=717944 RepID=UPI00046231BA|nr:uncharacterized protein TRAVEDRAFT_31204 [Trametes versicolor FP-101664 SS1]EIW54012.1 hypothetical protein TRAVEDRAFT_31204 [Trametes versicolor FP-101664 SS1]
MTAVARGRDRWRSACPEDDCVHSASSDTCRNLLTRSSRALRTPVPRSLARVLAVFLCLLVDYVVAFECA